MWQPRDDLMANGYYNMSTQGLVGFTYYVHADWKRVATHCFSLHLQHAHGLFIWLLVSVLVSCLTSASASSPRGRAEEGSSRREDTKANS